MSLAVPLSHLNPPSSGRKKIFFSRKETEQSSGHMHLCQRYVRRGSPSIT